MKNDGKNNPDVTARFGTTASPAAEKRNADQIPVPDRADPVL
jgi:hypothetical protein